MLAWGEAPPRSYKSYKNEMFNKKIEKAKSLLKSIDSLSLRPEDKALLKKQIKELS